MTEVSKGTVCNTRRDLNKASVLLQRVYQKFQDHLCFSQLISLYFSYEFRFHFITGFYCLHICSIRSAPSIYGPGLYSTISLASFVLIIEMIQVCTISTAILSCPALISNGRKTFYAKLGRLSLGPAQYLSQSFLLPFRKIAIIPYKSKGC